MKPSKTLRAALAKMPTPDKWTQERNARTIGGVPCPPESRDAHCYCAVGAVSSVYPSGIAPDAPFVFLRRAVGCDVGELVLWNDQPERTYPQVVEAFQVAIALAESAGQ